MANKTVKFKVTPGDNIRGYWITAGGKQVDLVDGEGSVSLPSGQKHMLVWWMIGPPGSALSIVGTRQGTTVVEVKNSKVPKDETQGGGAKRFEL